MRACVPTASIILNYGHSFFSAAQMELLSILNLKMSDSEVKELRAVLADFVAKLAQRKIDQLDDLGMLPSESELQDAHYRTAYR